MIKFNNIITQNTKPKDNYDKVISLLKEKKIKQITQEQFNIFFDYIFEQIINIGSAEIISNGNSKSRIYYDQNEYCLILDNVQIEQFRLKTDIINLQDIDIKIKMFLNCKIKNCWFNDFESIVIGQCNNILNCNFSNIDNLFIQQCNIFNCKFSKIKQYNFSNVKWISNSVFNIQTAQIFKQVETSNFLHCKIVNINKSKQSLLDGNKYVTYYKTEFSNINTIELIAKKCKFNNCKIDYGKYLSCEFTECKFDTQYAGAIELDTPQFNQCDFFIECIIQGNYIYLDGKKLNPPQRTIKQYRLRDFGIMLDDSVNQQIYNRNDDVWQQQEQ